MAALLLACGVFMFLIRDWAPLQVWRSAAWILAPAVALHGILGLFYPPATLDPTLDVDSLDQDELQTIAGTVGFLLGGLAFLIGGIAGAIALWVSR